MRSPRGGGRLARAMGDRPPPRAALRRALDADDAPVGVDRLARRTAELAAALGPEHVAVGRARAALGDALRAAGRLDEAAAAFRAVLAVREAALGPDDPEHAPVLLELAGLAAAVGDAAGALALASRATALLDGRVPADHPLLREARAAAAVRPG
jgi:tetratricopeptide (TPR) repeat protein